MPWATMPIEGSTIGAEPREYSPLVPSSPRNALISPLLYALLFFSFSLLITFNPYGHDVFLLPKWSLFLFLTLLYFALFLSRTVFAGSLPLPSLSLALTLLPLLYSTTLSTLFSLHPPSSSLFLGKIVGGSVLALCVSSLFQEQKLSLLRGYAIASLFVSLYALLQKQHLDFVLWSDPSVYQRPASFSGNPVFLGSTLTPAVLIFGHWALTAPRNFRLFSLLALSLTLTTLSLTFSRGAYLAVSLSALSYFLLSPRRKEILLMGALGLLLALPPIYYLGRKPVSIGGQGRVNLLTRVTQPALSNKIRLVLWRDAGRLFQKKPWLGWGAGIFPLFYPKARGVEILRWQSITALPEDAHNLLAQLAATQGLLGVFSLFLLFSSFFLQARRTRTFYYLFSLLLATSLPILFEPWDPENFLLFFILLGIPFESRKILISFPLRQKLEWLLLSLLFLTLSIPYTVKPVLADFFYKKATTAMFLEHYQPAILYLIESIAQDPQNLDAPRELARTYRKAYQNQKNPAFLKEAIRLYQKLLREMPFDASLYAELGLAYATNPKNPTYRKLAIRNYQKAIQKDPRFPLFYNDLGILYLNRGKDQKAKEMFYRAIQLVPSFYEPYKNLSVLFHRLHRNPAALRFATEALALNPKSPDLHAQLALLLQEAGEKARALQAAKKAYALSPTTPYRTLLSQLEQ